MNKHFENDFFNNWSQSVKLLMKMKSFKRIYTYEVNKHLSFALYVIFFEDLFFSYQCGFFWRAGLGLCPKSHWQPWLSGQRLINYVAGHRPGRCYTIAIEWMQLCNTTSHYPVQRTIILHYQMDNYQVIITFFLFLLIRNENFMHIWRFYKKKYL